MAWGGVNKRAFKRKVKLGASRALGVALVLILGPGHIIKGQAQAQDISAKVLSFEVASIKPGQPGFDSVRMQYTADGFLAENTPVQLLIQEAYGIREHQTLGLPDWAKTENYDVYAKVSPADAPELQKLPLNARRALLIPLLADRFKLIVHTESQTLPIYALVVAKGGPKLNDAKPNSVVGAPQSRMLVGFGQLSGQGVPVSSLVRVLSEQNLGRKIVDKSGLTGNYDIELRWSPEASQTQLFATVDAGSPAPPPDTGPSIFTALQEELGLKLESQKGPVDTIVVDHIERPSPN